jgi:lipopolysaccharide/colanic/teichoic acid biosynthesis glycosyltransferase
VRLVVVRETRGGEHGAERGGLEYAYRTAPLQAAVFRTTGRLTRGVEEEKRLCDLTGLTLSPDPLWLVPETWQEQMSTFGGKVLGYADRVDIADTLRRQERQYAWMVVSNGRFAAHLDGMLLQRMLDDSDADVLAVNAAPDLQAYNERIRLTPQGDLAGYRRLYRDTAQPVPLPTDWPHHLFVRSEHAATLLEAGGLDEFSEVITRCRTYHLKVRAAMIAGTVLDLSVPDNWLPLIGAERDEVREATPFVFDGHDGRIAAGACIVGPVLLADDVCIETDAVVVGPSILCQGAAVRKGAVIDAAVIGQGVVVEPEQVLERVFLARPEADSTPLERLGIRATVGPRQTSVPHGSDAFRLWPRLSYARCFKRMVDIAVALIVLLLFLPIIPVIALAIKINSPGPVFFRDKRQGFHGRLFNCIKFRTMRVGAADIQDKLRFVSEVDGPQFKMADDPRISTVGRFLRETYLDEIPQFLNVLCGDMSVVGPRPSPESENTLCPWWRDARLSVRPGITGLWQVKRTRQPFQDFQEWICYDTHYVCNLSPRMDLWICWRTFMNMLRNFAHQF